jgi:TP901 family phage tail tape measure protein
VADDLVAELTLTLRNELNAGVDAVKQEFTELQEAAGGVTDVVGELCASLMEMQVNPALAGEFEAAADALDSSVKASVASIDAAIDADIAKVKELQTALADADAAAAAGGGGGGGGSGINDPDKPKKPAETENLADGNSMLELLAIGSGYESFKSYSEFQQKLVTAAQAEHLKGDAAFAEVDRVADMLDAIALKYNQKSDDLASAYSYLITTGMKPGEVDALMPGLAEASSAHGIDVSDLQGAVMALNESYKISPDQMGEVLGQLGYATKMGHFGAESFGAFLPQIGGALSAAGVSGPDAADYTFAALESIIKNVSIPSEAATDYTDFIHYIGTQHAERSFLQRSRMMLPEMRAIFSKYHIEDADLWGMQDSAMAEGKDPIQTVLDYVHNATKNMTPTDRNAVISDYFTNQQGGDAVRALMQYWNGGAGPDGQYEPGFQDNFNTLKGINQSTLDDDFHTSQMRASADLNTFGETVSELSRNLGKMFDYVIAQPVDAVANPSFLMPGAPQGAAPGLGAMHPNTRPMELHVIVSHAGGVSVTPKNVPAGTSVRVNHGQVLGAH